MANWRKKQNPIPLIEQIERTRSINTDGNVQFGGFVIMTNSPKLHAMIEVNPEITIEDKHGIVRQSIFNIGRQGKLSKTAILDEIKKLEREYLSSRSQNFILASSLSIDRHQHKIPNLQIDKNKVIFSRTYPSGFIKAINSNTHITFFYRKQFLKSNYLCVRIAVKAKSVHQATSKALESLNIFRGILNFTINYGQQSFSFGAASRKPINKVLLGPIHTLHKPNGEMAIDDLYWYEAEHHESLKPYQDNTSKRFEEIVKVVKQIRKKIQYSKIKGTLNKAILLYNDALDSCNYEISYSKLWAVLELLTATGQNDDHKVTVRRAAFIFNNPDEERTHLELLREFRNDLIHKGQMNAKLEFFVYDLKLYVEKLLRFLIFNHSHFSSLSDIAYLLDRSHNPKELMKKSRLDKVAGDLNKSRK